MCPVQSGSMLELCIRQLALCIEVFKIAHAAAFGPEIGEFRVHEPLLLGSQFDPDNRFPARRLIAAGGSYPVCPRSVPGLDSNRQHSTTTANEADLSRHANSVVASYLRSLLISRLKVRFLPRSPQQITSPNLPSGFTLSAAAILSDSRLPRNIYSRIFRNSA